MHCKCNLYNHLNGTTSMQKNHDVSDEELKNVIADFLEMGHVENIVAMFCQDQKYYSWCGDILKDERFHVRLGMAVLFEELKILQPEQLKIAVGSLLPLLDAEEPLYRGEAVSLLGIINTPEALFHIKSRQNDPNPQVREMVELVLSDSI